MAIDYVLLILYRSLILENQPESLYTGVYRRNWYLNTGVSYDAYGEPAALA
jgi:hypothetical protein